MKNKILIITMLFLFTTIVPVIGQVEKSNDKKLNKKEKRALKKKSKNEDASKDKEIKPDNNENEGTNDDETEEKAKGKDGFNLDDIIDDADKVKEKRGSGVIDWTDQYFEATGESVIDTVRFKNYAQARAMARRGAIVTAQRNLLEMIKGVNIVGETTVEDMITTKDYIYSRVEGVIKGAEIVGEPKEEFGMIIVTMRVPMYATNGLAPAVYDQVSEDVKKKYIMSDQVSPDQSTGYTSGNAPEEFVFNLNGKQFDPAMFPLIVDEDGKVLFDYSKIYDPQKGKFPKILSHSKDIMKEIGFNEGVKVIDVIEAQDGKLVVSTKEKFDWNKVFNFLGKVSSVLMLLI